MTTPTAITQTRAGAKNEAKSAVDPSGRAWQRMLSGRRLDLLDPSPVDIEIEDIAHGLSRVGRWNGQTTGPWAYSVAQHSVLVEHLVSRLKGGLPMRWRLAALLHDSPEYVIGDMITPFKAVIGPDYKVVEARLMQAVHIRFGLPGELPATINRLIKRADRIAAYLEATQLAGFETVEARGFFGRPAVGTDITITPDTPERAKDAFLEKFQALGG